MGTHPIFESDFDCLTDEMKSGKDVKQDLKTADDLVNQLKRIYNDGYTAHAIDITKHFVHHVKGTLDKLDRNTDEFKEFRQGLQSSILEHLSKKNMNPDGQLLFFVRPSARFQMKYFWKKP